ncbi:hypothetical protein Gpo141_00010568 [Globisporangium polare]
MSLRVGMKRSRDARSKTRLHHRAAHGDDSCAMMVDADSAALVLDDSGFEADKDDDEDDTVDTYYSSSSSDANGEQPRRKRAMLIKANIQFLQKLPPLRNYQRSQSGRRGAVDGGTPDGDIGIQALEETMGESSFSVSAHRMSSFSRPAIVAPAPMQISNQRCHQQHQRQQSPQYPQVHTIRRNTSMAFASRPPASLELIQYRQRGLSYATANAGSKKDDEFRPATNGSGFW